MPAITRKRKAATANLPPPTLQPSQPTIESSRAINNRNGKRPEIQSKGCSRPSSINNKDELIQEGAQQSSVSGHLGHNSSKYVNTEITASILRQSMLDGSEEREVHEQIMREQGQAGEYPKEQGLLELMEECPLPSGLKGHYKGLQLPQTTSHLKDQMKKELTVKRGEELVKDAEATMFPPEEETDREPITNLQFQQYKAHVCNIRRMRIITQHQEELMLRAGLVSVAIKKAAIAGVFDSKRRLMSELEFQTRCYQEFLEDVKSKALLDENQMERLKKEGLRYTKETKFDGYQRKDALNLHRPKNGISIFEQQAIVELEKSKKKDVPGETLPGLETSLDTRTPIQGEFALQTILEMPKINHDSRAPIMTSLIQQYESFLTFLAERGFIDMLQMERMKRVGLQGTNLLNAASGGVFSKPEAPSSVTISYYENFVDSMLFGELIRRDQWAELKRVGLRNLVTLGKNPATSSHPISTQERQENSVLVGNPTEIARMAPVMAQTEAIVTESPRGNHRQRESDVDLHIRPQGPPRPSSVPKHDEYSSWSAAVRDQLNFSAGHGNSTHTNQILNANLVQQKANEQGEKMGTWSKREREVAAYKEERRKAKESAKAERRTKKERDIVSSAIDAVMAEISGGPLRSSIIDSLGATSSLQEVNKPASKPNAFSMMKVAQSKAKTREWKAPPVDFVHYIFNFEKSLELTDCRQMTDKEWAKFLGKKIAACVQSDILSQIHEQSHVQTRINAMNALMEISTAVAYTPGVVADIVRAGHTPGYLVASLFMAAEKFSEVETKRMLKEKWFMETLTQLRREPAVKWEGDVWNGLDDVLRLLNDPGPVDFRRVFKKVKEKLDERSKSASSFIIKAFRRDISDYVTHNSCFETKYNALNVLADIGVGFLQGTLIHPWRDEKLVVETLCGALLKIGQTLTVHEIEQIVEEFRMDEKIPNADFSTTLDQLLIPTVTQSLYTLDNNCHRALEKMGILLRNKSQEKTSEYCESSLLMKLYFIGWKPFKSTELWGSSKTNLQELLSILVGTSAPIQDGEYISKINKNFAKELLGQTYENGCGTLRESVDRSIYQILKRASSKATYESRTNAFKILTKIGLQLVGWLDPTQPFWKTRIFKDQMTEDSLTDAMRSICHSLVKEDRTKLLADEELMKDITSLNTQRLQLPDAMLGLDATMDMINGVEDLSTSAAMVSARNKRKGGEVFDLTGSVPSKRQAVARTPAKAVVTIDLTDD